MRRGDRTTLALALFLVLLAVYLLSRPVVSVTLVKDYCRDVGYLIDNAHSHVSVAVFLMRYDGTDRCPSILVKKLAEARKRGVKVEVFLAEDNYNAPAIEFLRENNVPVYVVENPLLHAKTLKTDDCFVIGSHNWTWNATHKNIEASVIVCGSSVIDEFFRELEERFQPNFSTIPLTRS